jgi:hypothetical protein
MIAVAIRAALGPPPENAPGIVGMKLVLLIAGLALASQAAVAQTSSCQSIANQMDRLACYDKASAPQAAAPAPRKAEKPAPAKAQPEQPQVVDMLAAENKKLDAKLKTICRGC